MAEVNRDEKARTIQEMFSRIAPRYDLMNRLMTFGQDVNWRRRVIKIADLPPEGHVLDLGAGTGDLAINSLEQCEGCVALATDFTMEMMLIGRERNSPDRETLERMNWVAGDATCLPYTDETFDAVVSGFLVRNLNDVNEGLREQYRVLKSGGKIVILDTTPPPDNYLQPLIQFHLHRVIPTLGRIVARNSDAYHYLPDSTELFLKPEALAGRLISVGFREVTFRRFMFGTVAIHQGRKL